jgi:hypothetical protein
MAEEEAAAAELVLLDTVALLAAKPDQGLRRGDVGTVVEELDERNVLVESSDDGGRAYAIVPCRHSELLVLH